MSTCIELCGFFVLNKCTLPNVKLTKHFPELAPEIVICTQAVQSKLDHPACPGSGQCCWPNNLVVTVAGRAPASVPLTLDSNAALQNTPYTEN